MSSDRKQGKQGRRPVGLTLIAVGKALKVVVLLVVAALALTMVNKSPPDELLHWADAFRIDPGNRFLNRGVEEVAGVSTKQLEELSVGTFVYAVVFAIEGVGLWLQKRWAEYLTIGVTVSFIPLEIYELSHHPSAGKIVTLVLNVAALVYLVVRVVGRRRERHGTGRAARGDDRRISREDVLPRGHRSRSPRPSGARASARRRRSSFLKRRSGSSSNRRDRYPSSIGRGRRHAR